MEFMQVKTDMDKLNEFLIKVANVKRVGIRRKVVVIKQYLKSIGAL